MLQRINNKLLIETPIRDKYNSIAMNDSEKRASFLKNKRASIPIIADGSKDATTSSREVQRVQSLCEKRTRPSRVKRSDSIIALEDLVQCGICLEKLCQPKMLPCQHTFCFNCLQSHLFATATRIMGKKHLPRSLDEIKSMLSQAETKLKCPSCKECVVIAQGITSLEKLPGNRYIDSLLNLLDDDGGLGTPTSVVCDIRCVKCQTVCRFEEQTCTHCKQIFCKICLTEHVSDLKNNLATLVKQLNESDTRLDHRMSDFQCRCQKLNSCIESATKQKIEEIRKMEQTNLVQVEDIQSQSDKSVAVLKKRILKIKTEIESLDFDCVHSNTKKVALFMDFHRSTAKLLDEISHWGETRITFDPATFQLDHHQEIPSNAEADDCVALRHAMAGTNLPEGLDAMSNCYRNKDFTPKLVWAKCPRPAGVGIAPWVPHSIYIAATDSAVVLVMDREKYKVIGKLTSPELLCPHDVAFREKSAEIFVSDKWKHCIHVFSMGGEYLRAIGGKGSIEGKLRSPEGIAFAANDALVVCDTGNDRVLLVDPTDGKQISVIGVVDRCTELLSPTGVAVFRENIVVADSGNHRIKVFSIDGKKLLEFGSWGNMKGQFRYADVVCCDPLGFILVGDAGNARVQVFRPDGSLVRVFGGFGQNPGKFAWVSGVAVTPQLDVITTDYKNRRLQIF